MKKNNFSSKHNLSIHTHPYRTNMSSYNPNDYDSLIPSQYVAPCVPLNPGRQMNLYTVGTAMQKCNYGMTTMKNFSRSFQCKTVKPIQEENGYLYTIEPKSNAA